MGFYIAVKGQKRFEIEADMIEDFVSLGYEIYKTVEVKVEDIESEVKMLKEIGRIYEE